MGWVRPQREMKMLARLQINTCSLSGEKKNVGSPALRHLKCSGSQPWLNIGITWRALKNVDAWGPPPQNQISLAWSVAC